MSRKERILRSAYRAFNAHDLDAALKLMHPDVDWPNAWQGGRVVGRAAVADYWRRQFSEIFSTVEPQGFSQEPDGSVTVEVHQVVHDARTGELLSDSSVRHRYWFRDDLVERMDVLDAGTQAQPDEQVGSWLRSRSGPDVAHRGLRAGPRDPLA